MMLKYGAAVCMVIVQWQCENETHVIKTGPKSLRKVISDLSKASLDRRCVQFKRDINVLQREICDRVTEMVEYPSVCMCQYNVAGYQIRVDCYQRELLNMVYERGLVCRPS